ncbi:hypothetical protein P4B35_02880 [Pontiellaceae bacterium B12227]|nr:hypothetical protein [Pontiellaceae bacterium B12227]
MKRDHAVLMLLSGLAAGCKSTGDFGMNAARQDQTRNAIQASIASPERRNIMMGVVDVLERDCKTIENRALGLRRQISEANRNYETPRAQLELLYSRLGELTVQFGETVKMRSLELRALCSRDEWKQIASHKTQAIHFTF